MHKSVGAREFVPFEYDEVTVENIKRACLNHFDVREGCVCDVLAGEQGPSCSSVKQIPNLNFVHVRLIGGERNVTNFTARLQQEVVTKANLADKFGQFLNTTRFTLANWQANASPLRNLSLGRLTNTTTTLAMSAGMNIWICAKKRNALCIIPMKGLKSS